MSFDGGIRLTRKRVVTVAVATGLVAPLVHVDVAFGQQTPGGGASPGGGAPGGGAPGGGAPVAPAPGGGAGTPTVTTVPGPTQYQFFPGGVAPTPPGQTLGGGNVEFSSSKPITGNERDTFDFRRGAGTATSVRGDPNSSFIIGTGTQSGHAGVVPNVHTVRRGDTLWGICDFYFHNPYQWPRIWSYNAQIQNPHWIYPGDQVRLREPGAVEDRPPPAPGMAREAITERVRRVPPDTIFLRNHGFIEDEQNNWGEITGAREDKIFLTDYDEVYLRIASNHDLKIGQELTVYRPIRSVAGGKLIAIQGTVKVDQWNPKERIARARVTETLDTIERGARVGPIARKFEVVPPTRNEKDVEAKVLTSIHPHELYGQNQVVFIDKGEDDGLRPGNRLFVIRKGDGFHQTHPKGSSAKRIAHENDSPAETESIPKPRNEGALPEEVIAELRVIHARKRTSMALVTASRREIDPGDHAVARKGY
jgi:hypothetical protein